MSGRTPRKPTTPAKLVKAKSPAKPAAMPPKVPQPHGGALLAGGKPGNAGGTGRPPSEIRALLRGSFADRIAILQAIADGEPVVKVRAPDGTETETKVSATPADRLKALDLLAKYGLGTQSEVTGADGGAVQVEVKQAILIGGVRIEF